MALKRDWIEYLVFFVVIAGIVSFFALRGGSSKFPEVNKVDIEGFTVKLPEGFHQVPKEEKKSYGFSERILVFAKGDMAHLIMIDVEKGLPLKIKNKDLDEYYRLTIEELRKNVEDISFVKRKKDFQNFGYEVIYTGKAEQIIYSAAYLSRLVPGKKLNITISVPLEQQSVLNYYLGVIRSGISYQGQSL